MITIEVKSADELLNELRPSAPRWRESIVKGFKRPFWIYRGQADSDWELIPSLFRTINANKKEATSSHFSIQERTRYREFILVQTFLDLVDREGILPPDFTFPGESTGNKVWWSDISEKIPLNILNSYALAQHHGIKTRLLDWTYSPFKAAYFAAVSNWRNGNYGAITKCSHFAIWAFVYHGSKQINVLSPKLSTNIYMKNQSGLFTIDPNADLNFNNGEWSSHNKLIMQDEQSSDGTVSTGRNFLYKIIVPSSIAEEVLIALRYEGVDQASLMPSFDSIANSVEEYLLLHERENKNNR